MNAANLALRFLLELAALGGFAAFAWNSADGIWRWVAAIFVVILVAAIWGTFAVPDDPSRSGNAPVPVPGWLRLLLEFLVLLGGAWAFYAAGHLIPGVVLAILVVAHYALSMERITWLLQQ